MAGKTRILIIGGTGYLGKFVVEASAKSGHLTFALVRESSSSDPRKARILDGFKSSGVNLVHGDLSNQESLLKAIKQVDVVISVVGTASIEAQTRIIAAIKEAGNIKRFFPSEFGNDVDRAVVVEPAKSAYAIKAKIRRIVEAEGIPYTYVCNNYFAVVFNMEEDIGTYTIKAVDDPRTLNKILYVRPPANTYSMNDLVSLWERKIGKTLERTYIPGDQVLQEATRRCNFSLSLHHSAMVRGDQTNHEIEPSFGVEASELYPDVKYTTVDQYLDRFV